MPGKVSLRLKGSSPRNSTLAGRRVTRSGRKAPESYQESSEEEFDSVNSSFNRSLIDQGHSNSPKDQQTAESLQLVANPGNQTDSVLKSVADRLQDFPAHRLDPGEPPVDSMPNNAAAAAVNFEDENGVDDDRALQEAIRNLEKVNWDPCDLNFVFNQVEIKMTAVGAKKSYTKFQTLSTILPKNVLEDVKPLLRKKEAEFPENNSYKLLKDEILRIHGPKPEAAVERALSRVLVGKPSSLARQLVNDLCKNELNCSCCPPIIMALWKRHLSGPVRAGIAHCKFNHTTFNAVLQLADDIFESNPPGAQVAAVRTNNSLDETLPAIPYAIPEVAAVSRGRGGRGRGRGNRGRGRGSPSTPSAPTSGAASSGPKHKGAKHPDLPQGEWTGCAMHFRWGKGAFFCSEPASCPWKNIYAVKPSK